MQHVPPCIECWSAAQQAPTIANMNTTNHSLWQMFLSKSWSLYSNIGNNTSSKRCPTLGRYDCQLEFQTLSTIPKMSSNATTKTNSTIISLYNNTIVYLHFYSNNNILQSTLSGFNQPPNNCFFTNSTANHYNDFSLISLTGKQLQYSNRNQWHGFSDHLIINRQTIECGISPYIWFLSFITTANGTKCPLGFRQAI